MEFIWNQLAFVRGATLKAVEDLEEGQADIIPQGFNNHIRWNLGHIYLVQEKFGLGFAGEPMRLPEGFESLFGNGTKPADWRTPAPPLSQIVDLLQEQPRRMEEALKHRLAEQVAQPFTTRSGLTLLTIGECVNFTLYHEGMHFASMKAIRRLI
ncbi:DinB family protein [Ammoniphilus sp. YIM 78166]|uniref:DinB family protein n=1 Tax=Ammoniphilus sp. YIM 78166 TaxID=1644106 RepID=UPI00106FDE6E|nr:DinB family protein [Ammoniphilus sp. YIM 78166]